MIASNIASARKAQTCRMVDDVLKYAIRKGF
jgi:hypothetical protein